MKFDRMGRRVEYIETVSGVTNIHHRFVYDGYLCIQRLNGGNNNSIDLVFGWDPSEQAATRPLVLQKYGQYSMFYTQDGNKNVSDLVFFQQANGIAAHYEYASFGAVTATSKSTPVTAYDFREYNPFRFSSEYADDALELVYFNYRVFNPMDGRWTTRDFLSIEGNANKYCFINNGYGRHDRLGLYCDGGNYGDFGQDIGTYFFGESPVSIPPDNVMSKTSLNSQPFGSVEGSFAAYKVFGMSFSARKGNCCQDGERYKWVTITTCVGMGIGMKLPIPDTLSVARDSQSECPPEGTVYTIGTGLDLPFGTLGGRAEVFGCSSDDGFYISDRGSNVRCVSDLYQPSLGASVTWRIFDICATSRIVFERVK